MALPDQKPFLALLAYSCNVGFSKNGGKTFSREGGGHLPRSLYAAPLMTTDDHSVYAINLKKGHSLCDHPSTIMLSFKADAVHGHWGNAARKWTFKNIKVADQETLCYSIIVKRGRSQ